MTRQARIDALLNDAVGNSGLPNLVAVIGDRDSTLYEGAAGPRSLGSAGAFTPDTVLWLASMSKTLTATAAMQQVEQGKLSLDAPAQEIVPEIGQLQVLEGFDAAGQPQLRAPRRAITLRHLLTHTAGQSYDFSSADIQRYLEATGTPSIFSCENRALTTPLLFDPGEAWAYGIGIDWAGKMVERQSGKSLGQYLREDLFDPLGMTSTSFKLSATQRAHLAGMHARDPDGALAPMTFEVKQDPEFEMGGGGLYSTARDYLRFMRMILNRGTLDGVRILREDTVALMSRDHCPGLDCGRIVAQAPTLSHHVDFFPGQRSGWGLSFMINDEPIPGGRAAGSLSWAGICNTYFWIDPTRNMSAMIATQMLPFFDPKMISTLQAFESAVYED